MLIGQDPLNVEAHLERIRTSGIFAGAQGGQYVTALTAVEIALWDLAGKALGLPVYQLLGGKVRDRVRMYCDSGAMDDPRSRKPIARRDPQIQDNGFTAAKIDIDKARRTRVRPRELDARRTARSTTWSPRFAFTREDYPKKIDLAVDMHGRYDAVHGQARRQGAGAVPPAVAGGTGPAREHRRHARHPRLHQHADLLRREHLSAAWGFREMLEKRAADIIMPDIQKCGGLLEARKIADMAHAYYVPVAPHASPRRSA